MSKIGGKSMFSVLKVDGASSSSEDEFQTKTSRRRNGAQKTKMPHVEAKGANSMKLNDGLVVHSVPKNNKKKNNAKTKVIDEKTGLVVQDATENHNAEKVYREDLKEALRESREAYKKEEARQMSTESIPEVLQSIDEKLRKTGLSQQHGKAEEMYREKILELNAELEVTRKERDEALEQSVRRRERYLKAVDLLRDAEVSDKAKLMADLRKSRSIENELSTQLSQLKAEYEKIRSRLMHYENKKV